MEEVLAQLEYSDVTSEEPWPGAVPRLHLSGPVGLWKQDADLGVCPERHIAIEGLLQCVVLSPVLQLFRTTSVVDKAMGGGESLVIALMRTINQVPDPPLCSFLLMHPEAQGPLLL